MEDDVWIIHGENRKKAGDNLMYPLIDRQATGQRIRQIMDKRGITIRNMQEYLGLSCVQSIYHWLDGTSLPSLDNLYAISVLLRVPIDLIVCGSHKVFMGTTAGELRMIAYYNKIHASNAV